MKRTAQTLQRELQEWPPERSRLYAQGLRQELAELAAFDRKRSDPEVVARVVYRALAGRRCRSRYTVGYMARTVPQGVLDRVMALRE